MGGLHQADDAGRSEAGAEPKRDADYVFFELTRSICPECRRVVDAHVLLRDNKVFMRKRCSDHGVFESLVYGDAEAYVHNARYNKPGTIPLAFNHEVQAGCPHDCGLCSDHQQHVCLGIIEINSACNMDCPLCFASAGAGFNLTLEEVEGILDDLVRTEGGAEVVQFSGGEPSIHPQIIPMLRAAKEREIRHVMLNTNGKRIAHDDVFLAQLAEIRPAIYFQFDGFDEGTYEALRGEPGILSEKLRALDRLAEIGCTVILVPAVERGVNEHELGRIIEFGIDHPAVFGVNFQPAFHSGRHLLHDPNLRLTIPDLLRSIEVQTDGNFRVSDFVPVPCCFPTCNSVTYAIVDERNVVPLPRLIDVEDTLDYITNRAIPNWNEATRSALEGLWSSSAIPGSEKAGQDFAISCATCDLSGFGIGDFRDYVFMVMLQDFMDPWTFNQKNLMKCCKEILLPGGHQIPFCSYNNVGYREQAREQLTMRQNERHRAKREGRSFMAQPITFNFDEAGQGVRTTARTR
jgi:7,8-dihydro-6-hydroxymethylpterin dimethyltransferase